MSAALKLNDGIAILPHRDRRCVVFENPGEIDIAAISTFGVSVKEGDSPIGFFGTGLKYALAILLRNGCKVTIWSGLDRIDFTAEPAMIRGQEFSIVCMNGERMGFTTQVGKTWDLWMAYRELFCNARDENGEVYASRSIPEPIEGITFVAVSGDAFEEVHEGRWKYFIDEEPDDELGSMHLWRRPSISFFYRGVSVHEMPRQAMFTYNDTSQLDLTEDRTVKNSYEVNFRIIRAIVRSEDQSMIRTILTAPERWYEHHLDFHGWPVAPSPTFFSVVEELVNDGCLDVNATARRLWQDHRPNSFKPIPVKLTQVQQKMLDKAAEFCEGIGFPINSYPVSVVESLGTDTLGLAKDGGIYVAERAFHMGTKQVAATLIEEYVHLRHLYEDCTRSMQNFLFEKMVSLGEEIRGEPL